MFTVSHPNFGNQPICPPLQTFNEAVDKATQYGFEALVIDGKGRTCASWSPIRGIRYLISYPTTNEEAENWGFPERDPILSEMFNIFRSEDYVYSTPEGDDTQADIKVYFKNKNGGEPILFCILPNGLAIGVRRAVAQTKREVNGQ